MSDWTQPASDIGRSMPLLTPREAATELNISVKHLRILPLPFINIGNAGRIVRRYEPDDIRQFKEANRCQPESVTVPKPTCMTSVGMVLDFQEIHEKLKKQKRRRSKRQDRDGTAGKTAH